MNAYTYPPGECHMVNAALDIVFETMMHNPIIVEDCQKHGKSGGLYCRVPLSGGPPSYVRWLGIVPGEKRLDYWNNAQKKCLGLLENPGIKRSADPAVRNARRKIWGGGVLGTDSFHALSGLTEDSDEIFSTYAALQQYDLEKEDALRILQSNALGQKIIATGGLRFGGLM